MPSRAIVAVVLVAAAAVAGVAAPTGATDAAPTDGTAVCGTATAAESAGANITITTLTAPGRAYERLGNASAIRDAVTDGTLVEPAEGTNEENRVAYGDVVVHRVSFAGNATAVLDAMAAKDGGSPGANFRALLAEENVTLSFRGPTACPPDLALNASLAAGAIRVVPDYEADTLYLVFDTERYLVRQGNSEPRSDRWDYGPHQLSLDVQGVDGRQVNTTAETQWETLPREVSFRTADDALLRTAAGDNRPFAFETSVAPGTELAVTLRPLAAGDPLTATTTVTANRTGRVTLDVPQGVYAVNVSGIEPTNLLVAAGNASGATLQFPDQETEDAAVYEFGVVTTDGGLVVVHNESGDVVGVSEPFGPGAVYPTVEVPRTAAKDGEFTATVVHDADGNGEYDAGSDAPYRVGGDPVAASASVDFRLESPQTSTTTTDSPTTATSTDATTTLPSNSTSTTTPTDTFVPGFGVAAALVALLTAAALAGRA